MHNNKNHLLRPFNYWNLFIYQLFTLWSWLPMRITMYQPILLYTTEEHGCSLTTFYVRVEQHEPTLLMIKTCNNEVSFINKYLSFKRVTNNKLKFERIYWFVFRIQFLWIFDLKSRKFTCFILRLFITLQYFSGIWSLLFYKVVRT